MKFPPWFVVLVIVGNGMLASCLNFAQLCPPGSRVFAVVTVLLVGLGALLGLMRSPLKDDVTTTTATLTVTSPQPDAKTPQKGAVLILALCWLAAAAALAFSLVGCSTLGGQAALKGWETCEVGKLPTEGEGVLVGVSNALEQADFKTPLEQLGVQVGEAQVDCAVQALVSFLGTKIGAKSEPTPSLLAKIARGKAWLSRHQAADGGAR